MCTEKFVDPFTDFGFKRLFGTEKEVLIKFLNSILPEEEPIVSLKYLNVERLGLTSANRNASFDLYCETKDKRRIIVELQRMPQAHFVERSIFYSSFAVQDAALKGDEWDFNLPRIYTVSLLRFNLSESKKTGKSYKHVVRLYDVDTKEEFTKVLTYIYFEMPKFKKSLEQLETLEDKWMYLINHLVKLDHQLPQFQEEEFVKFFELGRIAAFTDHERRAYEASLKDARDRNNQLRYAEEQAEARGEAKKTFELAKAFKADGIPVAIIAKNTGLTQEEIEKL